MNCIIIDDDILARKSIEKLISKIEFLNLRGSFENALQGLSHLAKERTDLIFLDMEMPGMSGLDLLRTLDKLPCVIIVSSKEEYALPAYDFEVVDYLVKPLTDFSRFSKAVMKADKKMRGSAATASSETEDDVVFLKEGTTFKKVKLSQIHFIEAYGDYIKVHTETGTHIIYTTMKKMFDALPDNAFVRIHRSYIARLDKIKNITAGEIEIGGTNLPISNTYREPLMKRIHTL